MANICPLSLSLVGFPNDQRFSPPSEHVKQNFDGSLNPFTHIACMGGIIRDMSGCMVAAYTEHLIETKIQALHLG